MEVIKDCKDDAAIGAANLSRAEVDLPHDFMSHIISYILISLIYTL